MDWLYKIIVALIVIWLIYFFLWLGQGVPNYPPRNVYDIEYVEINGYSYFKFGNTLAPTPETLRRCNVHSK